MTKLKFFDYNFRSWDDVELSKYKIFSLLCVVGWGQELKPFFGNERGGGNNVMKFLELSTSSEFTQKAQNFC